LGSNRTVFYIRLFQRGGWKAHWGYDSKYGGWTLELLEAPEGIGHESVPVLFRNALIPNGYLLTRRNWGDQTRYVFYKKTHGNSYYPWTFESSGDMEHANAFKGAVLRGASIKTARNGSLDESGNTGRATQDEAHGEQA